MGPVWTSQSARRLSGKRPRASGCRGLPPRTWTAQYCTLPTEGAAQYVGCSPAQPQLLPSCVVLATDGSGGPFSSEPRLRRCGWAFVAMDVDGDIVAQGWGPLEGWRQTVPLSELEAATQLAASIQGDLQLYVDASYLVRGVRRGPEYRHQYHAHQWRRFLDYSGGEGSGGTENQSPPDPRRGRVLRASRTSRGTRTRRPTPWQRGPPWRRSCRPTPSQRWARHDDETLQVQQHLLAVATIVAKAAPQLYGPSSRLQRRPDAAHRARERAAVLDEAGRLTQHVVNERTGRCLRCLRAPSAELPRLAFLQTACTGQPYQIHESHVVRHTRGLRWCEKRGGLGHQRFVKLGRACMDPPESAKRAIRRLQDGVLPYGFKSWPDEGEDLVIE